MKFEREQEIKIDDKIVYLIDVILVDNEQYLYVQEIEDDELVEKYYVYKYVADKNAMIHIKEPQKLEKLLKLFADNINASL